MWQRTYGAGSSYGPSALVFPHLSKTEKPQPENYAWKKPTTMNVNQYLQLIMGIIRTWWNSAILTLYPKMGAQQNNEIGGSIDCSFLSESLFVCACACVCVEWIVITDKESSTSFGRMMIFFDCEGMKSVIGEIGFRKSNLGRNKHLNEMTNRHERKWQWVIRQ